MSARPPSASPRGGGASFFAEGRQIGGDPLSDAIAAACAVVFGDETEHGEHGASEFAHNLHTEEEWAEAREIVTAICQQRLRMRYEMFGLPIDEARITEITEGTIPSPSGREPSRPLSLEGRGPG